MPGITFPNLEGSFMCNCVGPQNGEPMCPCSMRNVQIKDDRYVMPEQDLGPVQIKTRVFDK